MAKAWHLVPHDAAAMERIAAALQVSPIAAQLLLNRGFADAAAARRFLDSPLTDLHPPELLPGVPQAVDLLEQAVREKKRICVYGDYDVDGISGTAILWNLFTLLGVPVEFHMPNRLEDGYGLRSSALTQLAQQGTQVVVTVDCGITGIDEARTAREVGLQLIITDHHEHLDALPAADVLVHPGLPGGSYPFRGLSGAGVAFKLAWALCQRISGSDKVLPKFREFLLDAVAMASLGLIADVVPLQDENRIFVRHGLARMQTAPTVGVKALLESAGMTSGATLRAEDVSFRLAPRLNAAGRLGCARLVVELLTTTNVQKARDLATYLDGQNKERQSLERRFTREAREVLEATDWQALPAIVLHHAEWHPGVIGIVAGRLAEQFGRPALVICSRDDPASGSGRSIPGFALHEALQACAAELISHGGHAAAAGFKVSHQRLDAFRAKFCEYTAGRFPQGLPPPRLLLDAEVPLSALTFGLLREIDRLEPYGAYNPRPRFLAGGLQIVGEPRRIGGGERHLSFRVRQAGANLRAVAFGLGERLEELLSAGGHCCLAFTPRINDWNGMRSIELEVSDFQACAQAKLE
ncbi:MAG TPA: single-stranded-DNA-specific exonuclease RecJ [Gemmataceae bacterium]|nr:single-stranded-DNA-specific exonuclease RecJ [Gemmataceae bacterium]